MSPLRSTLALLVALASTAILGACDPQPGTNASAQAEAVDLNDRQPPALDPALPTIGLLLYDSVLTTEVTASADVFSKKSEDGRQLFNVVTIAETLDPIRTEDALTFLPDYTFATSPKLDVLFVPSAYNMWSQVHNPAIVEFIRRKNEETTYTVSNCAGAQLIGAAGIADGHRIVTWIGGGEQLQQDYPALEVQDDSTVTFVEDGKFLSSNGNLASYVAALELVEKLTSPAHRKFVESYIYLERLQNWAGPTPEAQPAPERDESTGKPARAGG